MPRQDAAFRLRDDPRATAAVATWGVVGAAVMITAAWNAAFRDPESLSWFGLCAGTTLAAGINLLADVVFHQSRFGRTKDGHGSLAAFVATVLPPFVPAAILLSENSLFALCYLTLLFAATAVLAWAVSERDGLLRLRRFAIGVKSIRWSDAVQKPPKFLRAANTPSAPVDERPIEQPSIVLLPQQRSIDACTSPPATDRKQLPRPDTTVEQDPSPRHVAGPAAAPQVWTPPRVARSDERRELSSPTSRILKTHGGHETPAEPKIAQWIKRIRNEAGGERVEGSVQVEFAAGQKQATVHIPFVPALSSNPRVECHAIDGAQVRLKVGLVQTFGTRIEVRRADAGENALAVEIAFSAAIGDEHSHAA